MYVALFNHFTIYYNILKIFSMLINHTSVVYKYTLCMKLQNKSNQSEPIAEIQVKSSALQNIPLSHPMPLVWSTSSIIINISLFLLLLTSCQGFSSPFFSAFTVYIVNIVLTSSYTYFLSK